MHGEKLTMWLGRLSAVVMLALLGWLGANIYWTLRAPESERPSAVLETDVGKAQQAIVARHLLGVYVEAGPTVGAASDIRLNGAIAADKPGRRAYALLSIEGKAPQLVREGEELAPGIMLQRVEARQVELMRGGQLVTLRLPESGKGTGDAGKGGAAGNLGVPPAPGTPPAPVIGANPPALVVEPAKVEPAKVEPAKVTPSPPGPAAPSRKKPRRNTDDDT